MCSFLQNILSSRSSFWSRYWWFQIISLSVLANAPTLRLQLFASVFDSVNINIPILSVIVNAHPLITIRWPLDYNMQDSQYGDAEKLTGLNNATTSWAQHATVAVLRHRFSPTMKKKAHAPVWCLHNQWMSKILTPLMAIIIGLHLQILQHSMAIFFKMRNARCRYTMIFHCV